MKKINFLADIKQAIDIALFRHPAMNHVAKDKTKNRSAVLIITIAAVLGVLGMKWLGIFSPGLLWILGLILYHIIAVIIGIYVLSFVATSIFKGSAKHDAFFRVMAFAMIVAWLMILPILGFFAGLWSILLAFSILKTIHKLTTSGALGALVVTVIAIGLIGMLLSPVFGVLGIKGMGGKFGNFNDGFKMNVETEDGTGSVQVKNGKMTIEGPDGEKLEIDIQQAQ